MEQYKVPLRETTAEFIEKRSRFISNIKPVSTEEEALSFLQSIRVKHREATHNVYAYRIKDNNICRYSDDGEPSGTAAMPLLEAFVKQDVFDFCCVATRYFGGILLGAGGLVRAYARCGAAVLEASGTGLLREMALCAASLPYAQYENIKRMLISSGAEVTSEDFGEEVKLKLSLPSELLPSLKEKVMELTSGSVELSVECVKMS